MTSTALRRRGRPAPRRLLRSPPDATAAPTPIVARAPRSPGPVLLEVADVTVRFGSTVANDAVSIDVHAGSFTALIGPNGAGKTTLFNVVTGAVRANEGRVEFAGQDITSLDRRGRARRGIVRTFQHLALVETATVRENVRTGTMRFVRGYLRDRDGEAITERALAAVGLLDRADELAGNLPYGLGRHVEIARALAAGPKLLLLDEPSAGMDAAETAALGALVATLVDELGVTVLLVEHDMAMVRPFADVVHVLHQGRLLASGAPEVVLTDDQVRRVYLGGVGAGA